MVTKNYDRNDMAYIFVTDYSQIHGYYVYHKFNPFWKYFKQGNITFFSNRSGILSRNNELKSFNAGFTIFMLFNSNWSIFTETGFDPIKGKDFNEPRIDGKYYSTPASNWGSINMTTNYNKTLAFDFGGRYYNIPTIKSSSLGYYIIPMVRVSDHFNIKFSHFYDVYEDDRGFAFTSGDSSIFGQRDIITVTNTLSSRYIFKNDMSLSLSARHYWSKGIYEKYFFLQENGDVSDYAFNDIHAYDFNSNYLTIDLVYNWQFAPGSSFIVTYKNLILSDSQRDIPNYFNNLTNTFSDPQINSLSLKILYYIDYQYFKKK
jgi:hypothetical protein